MHTLRDLIKPNTNSFYDWNELTKTYNIEGNYLHYYNLIHTIPNEWKTRIKGDLLLNLWNDDNPTTRLIHKLLPSKKPSRTAYNEFVFNRNDQPYDRADKWAVDMSLRIDDIEFYTLKSVVIHSFLYRFYLQDLYPRQRLFKMKLVDSPLCIKCKQVEESIMHMFWVCGRIQSLWTEVQSWIDNLLGIHLPMDPDIILLYYGIDIPVEYYPLIVLILTLVKQLIYDNKDNWTNVSFIQVIQCIDKTELMLIK